MCYSVRYVTISVGRTACNLHQAPWSRAFQLRLSLKQFCVFKFSMRCAFVAESNAGHILSHIDSSFAVANCLVVVCSVRLQTHSQEENTQNWNKFGRRLYQRENMNMETRSCKSVLRICFFTKTQTCFRGSFGVSTSVFTPFPWCVGRCNFPPLTGATP